MKKSYFLSLLFALLFINSYGQQCAEVVATALPSCGPGEAVVLTAKAPIGKTLRETTSYTVAPVTYELRTFENAGDVTSIMTDDDWSQRLNLYGKEDPLVQKPDFNFCFYGKRYRDCLIGDNGAITFDIQGGRDSPGGLYAPNSFCQFTINSALPFMPGNANQSPFKNAIMGVLQDLKIDYPGNPATTSINYFTRGVAPCRLFVANWTDVQLYSCQAAQGLQSYQIVLYESSNIIEVHITKRTPCPNWPGGALGGGIVGLNGSTVANSITAPNRNLYAAGNQMWSTQNEGWRFTPNGPEVPVTYNWYLADALGNPIGYPTAGIIGTGQSLTVFPPVTTKYVVVASYRSCDPSAPNIEARDSVDAIVGTGSTSLNGVALNLKNCDTQVNPRVFDIGVNTLAILGTADPNDILSFDYYPTYADALATTDRINVDPYDPANPGQSILYTLPTPDRFRTIYARIDDLGGCMRIKEFTINLLACENDLNVCDIGNDDTEVLDLTDYTSDYNNSNSLDGINPGDYSNTYHTTVTDADNIGTAMTAAQYQAFTAVEGTTVFVRFTNIADPTIYFVKAFEFHLNPNPGVTITGGGPTCAGSVVTISVDGEEGSTVTYSADDGTNVTIENVLIPAGGTYNFTTPAAVPATTYTYTLISSSITTNGFTCSEALTQTAVVTVGGLPTAAFDPANPTSSCAGTTVNLAVQGTAGAIITYLDHQGNTVTMAPLDASGNGTIVTPTLVFGTTYTYTLQNASSGGSSGCSQTLNDIITVTVLEMPTATISPITTQVCLGDVSQVSFTGTANSLVQYTLNTVAQPPITIDSTGQFTLTETLTPVGSYRYELVSVASIAAPACSQAAVGNVTVNVVGAPTATIATTTPTICSGDTPQVQLSGTPGAIVSYTVTGDATVREITLNPSTANPLVGEATIPATALTADTTYQLIKVRVTGTAACETTLTDFVLITVKPLPTATIEASKNICSASSTTVIVTGTPNSTVNYTLNGAPNSVVINGGGTGTINTGTLTADATYVLVSISVTDIVTCTNTLTGRSVVGVLPLPTASFTALPNICSNRTTTIDFTGTPNATVNFTYTVGTVVTPDSITLNGAGFFEYTTVPITAVTTFDLVSASSAVVGSNPSCTAAIAGSLTITPIAAPVINFSPTPLEVCDDNDDGVALFNLTDKNAEIVGAGSTLVVTYHETMENAIDNVFAKADPYENLTNAHPGQAPYYMYVRVQEVGGSQCPSFTQLRLIVNRTPQPIAPTTPIEICDDATADGFAIFPDLTVKEPQMLLDLNTLDTYTFTYYLTEAEALGTTVGTPLVTVNYPNTTAFNQTIWVRVTNQFGCFKAVPIRLVVNPNPVIPAPGALAEYTLCDVTNSGDGKEIFDLESRKALITTVPGMDIQFYFDNAAVTAGTPLPLMYENVVVPAQTIIVVVTNTATGCSSNTTLTLRVEQLPLITIPAITPELCDINNNGSASFDLAALIPEITGGAGYTVTFHETYQNAVDDEFPYPSPYANLASGIIYIRAEDPVTGCFSVEPLQLIVNPIPQIPSGSIDPLVVCDTNADQIRRVDLVAHAEPFLLPQPVAGTYDITYYLSEANAEQGTIGAITTPSNYLATDGDVIWVRITNRLSKCYEVSSFLVTINPAAAFASVEYSLCDEGLPNDGFTEFDLTTQNSFFGAPAYDIVYSTLAGVVITTPEAYTNTSPGVQTLRVSTTNIATGCVSNATLTIRVVPLPNPKLDPTPIEACDNESPGDGLTVFDLTIRETYIKNGATNATLFYYIDRNQAIADGDQGTTFPNAIPTPANFTSTIPYNQTIYVLVVTNFNNPTAKRCYQIVELNLIVNPIPALGNNGVIKDFVACLVGNTGTYTFTLSDHNANVLAPGLDPADYTITYYDSQPNADAGTTLGVLPNSYTNGTNPEPIWVRVKNNATPCFNVGSFNLVVDEAAVANPVSPTEPLLTTCDNYGANDGSAAFNLTPLNDIILGVPAPANFTIHYYDNEADYLLDLAEGVTTTNSRAIPDITDYVTGTKDIIAMVINRTSTTGCPARVDFTLTVNKLPEVTLEDGFFCFDPISGLPLNTYALTANVDPATGNYTFDWTKDGSPYPVADNTSNVINVDQKGIYSVIVTNTDTGCVSEPSNNATVEPTSNAIATASVTGYFTDNATITVVVDAASLGSYEFKLDEGAWQTSNVFSPVATGTHLVYIRDVNDGGCGDLPPLEVNVINYPKFFTPNGDGYHDTWTIVGLGENAKIHIFDRYGKLVKQIASGTGAQGEGWNGTMNGQPLPATDYWFKVEYLENDVMKEFRAHFSLKR